MIEKIVNASRTTEVDAITTLIINAYLESSNMLDVYLANIITTLKPYSASLNIAINRIQSESELEDADEGRADAVRGFFYQTNGYTYNVDETIKTAAIKVIGIFNHYGLQILSQNYSTVSSLVDSLITDLSTDEIQENIALLPGIAESLAIIVSTQNNFKVKNLTYEQEKAKTNSQETATSLKKQVLNIINQQLITYLRAMVVVNETDYKNLGLVINQIVTDNNNKVKQRLNSSTNSDEETTSTIK